MHQVVEQHGKGAAERVLRTHSQQLLSDKVLTFVGMVCRQAASGTCRVMYSVALSVRVY